MRWLLALLFALAPSLALGAYYPTCEQTPSCVCDPGSQADQDIPVWVDDGTPAWELRTLSSHFSVGASDVSISSTFTQAGSCVGDVSGELCSNYARFSTAEVDMNAASLKVPQSTDCSGINGEGKLCWETDRELLWMGSDATTEIPATIAQSTDCSGYTGEGEACWETDVDKLTIGDGTTQVTGATASMTTCVDLPVRDLQCRTGSNPCGFWNLNVNNYEQLSAYFLSDQDSYGSWSFWVPNNLTGTTASFRFHWFSSAGVCDNGAEDDVCWVVHTGSLGDGDNYFSASLAGTEVGTPSRCPGQNIIQDVTVSSITHGFTAGERGILRLWRDDDGGTSGCGGATGDDFTSTGYLLGARVCFDVSDPLGGDVP